MNKLIVDVGNTNIKFGFFNKKDKLVRVGMILTKNYTLASLRTILTSSKYDAVFVGSVVKEITNRLVRDLQFVTKMPVTLITADHFKKVFNLDRFCINEIGSDILALALTVKQLVNDGIGVSFGTATFAVVVKGEELIGVAIAPSIELGTKQLGNITSLIKNKSISTKLGNLDFGCNTTTSLQSGGSHMARGFVMSILEYANKHYQINKAIVTGGKTNYLKFIDKTPHIKIVDNAVLLGYYQITKVI
jgi:pantothenate kinase type III